MLKRFLRQFLLDLGDLEGDYRISHLKDDLRQSVFYILIVTAGVLSMIETDRLLHRNQPETFGWLMTYRVGFAVISILIMIAILRTRSVKVYDRLMTIWLWLVIIFLLLFNFTRPIDFLTTAYGVIIPFAIYIISPQKILHSFALAFAFSAGTLYIDYFYRTGIDPATLKMVLIGQLIVHLLGLGAAIQIQSYRRKSFRAYTQEKDAKDMLAHLANIDPLTKSLTRRQFFDIAESEFLRFSRYRRPLSLLALDPDHFKKINDTYGHDTGDLVLQSLSLMILEQKRTQDTFGRLGQEGFGLLLPETTLEQAKVIAERVQKAWAETTCHVDDKLIRSTVSVGVAEVNDGDRSFEDLLRRADRLLYEAKQTGRNRVVAEQRPHP